MNRYIIRREEKGVELHYAEGPQERSSLVEITPKASQAIINHSPNGFEFGYSGSGPSQLALAILLDHFTRTKAADPRALAFEHYQDFKRDFIAIETEPGVGAEFEIGFDTIVRWHGERASRPSGSYLGS